MNYNIFYLVVSLSIITSKTSSIDSLKVNHLKSPFGIDIYDNNFSFRSDESGPFKAKIFLDNTLKEEKEILLENSHSFSFDNPLEYNKTYKYVVESTTSKAELEFETSINLEKS